MGPKIPVILFALIVLVFTRFWNLESTARFIWDESSDLVNIHQIWEEKNITLVGPISEDGNKVFGSLTYYMLLPFAVVGGFSAASTAYGAAFWSILTAILLYFYLARVARRGSVVSFLLAVSWMPLLQSGRWAWNPNLIPFWVILSLWLLRLKKPFFIFLAGLCLGLTFHHHYLAVFMVTLFLLLYARYRYLDKQLHNIAFFGIGVFLAISPFIIFDITHPPGLFLSRILYFNYLGNTSTANVFALFVETYWKMVRYFIPTYIGALVSSILLPLLFIKDVTSNSHRHLFPGLVWLGYLIWLSTISVIHSHYFLPISIFFIVWLTTPRRGVSKLLANSTIFVIIVASLFSLPSKLTERTWESDITSIERIVQTIETNVTGKDLKNVNLIVIGSADPNIYGRRYRDLMLTRGKVKILSKDEMPFTDNMFVVSSSNEDRIRQDPAVEMNGFRDGPLRERWEIEDSPWKIYLFNRGSRT